MIYCWGKEEVAHLHQVARIRSRKGRLLLRSTDTSKLRNSELENWDMKTRRVRLIVES